MAEPSHRSTTSATPRSPVDVGRDADLLTSRDLEITRARTNGNAGDSDGSGPSDQGVAPAARHRRARHAKVTGDDSPVPEVTVVTEQQVPMRPDLLKVFEFDEIVKYYTADEIAGHPDAGGAREN